MLKKEILFNFIFTFIINTIAFIQNKYFIKYMGIETLGMIKIFTQLLAYLNIIEMGIGGASSFALYKPLANKDCRQVSIIVSTIESIYNKIAILLLGFGILFTPIIPFFMKISEFSNVIYFYWVLYVLNTGLSYLFIKYVVLFTANQEFLYVRFVQVISKFSFQLLQIFFIIKYKSLFIYIILLISDNIAQWILFRSHYKNKYSYIIKTKEKFTNIKNDIKNLFWHKIGGLVVFNTDLILISKFTSLEIVGVYTSYQMIFQIIRILIGILTNVITPKIGKFISLHTKEKIYDEFKKINIIYCFIATFFTYCTYILINNFIKIWLGNIVLLNKFTIILLCFNLWINLFRDPLDAFKAGSGFFDDIKSPILESIVNLTVSIVLGIKLGLDGVIIGTIVSNVIVILIYKPILVFKRCFNKDIKEYLKLYVNYLVLVIISILSCKSILRFILLKNVNSWFDWIVNGVVIGSLTFIIIFVIFLSNKNFRKNLFLLKNK